MKVSNGVVVRDAVPGELEEVADLTLRAFREYRPLLTPYFVQRYEQDIRDAFAGTTNGSLRLPGCQVPVHGLRDGDDQGEVRPLLVQGPEVRLRYLAEQPGREEAPPSVQEMPADPERAGSVWQGASAALTGPSVWSAACYSADVAREQH